MRKLIWYILKTKSQLSLKSHKKLAFNQELVYLSLQSFLTVRIRFQTMYERMSEGNEDPPRAFQKKRKKKSVEIFHMMSRLRMQNLAIIGQGVPELQGVTDRQRNYFSNIDNQFTEQL